ncbi:MAG: O-antigen ligase family protein [Gaiellaceae bacterium]
MPVWSQWLSRAEARVVVATAIAVAGASFTHGGYFPREWGWMLLAFALAMVLVVLVHDRIGLGRFEVAAIVLLAAFTSWTALSTLWSVSAAQPLLATERTLVYAAALPAALLLARPPKGSAWLLAGVIVAVAAVCGYALASRLIPGWVTVFPSPDGYQLQTPIGYWNGLAILAAMAAVAAVGTAAEARARTARMLAAAALPMFVTTLYFTFSRGGLLAFVAGCSVAVVVTMRRLHLLAMFVAVAPTATMAVWYASRFTALTRAGASLADARTAGRHVGFVLVLCTALAAAVGWMLPALEQRVHVGARVRRLIGVALVGVLALVVVAVLVRVGGPSGVASKLSASFNRSLPQTGGDLNRRLASFSSDGRADYWRVAWREVRADPWLGGGAGSYERYWHRYRPTAFEAQNAHNLYLETLAELGPVGLGLLLAFLAVPFLAAMRNRARPAVTAAAGAFAAFVVHCAIDWDFQIVAVTLAGLFCAASLLAASRPDAEPAILSIPARIGGLAVLLPLTALAVAMQIGNSALANAATALDRGDSGLATRLAARARTWQPWSYEPLQLRGEAELAAGRRADAQADFRRALARDPANWSLWYDLAQATRGTARASAFLTARRLNPRAQELVSPQGT